MKKTLSIICALMCCLLLFGCSEDTNYCDKKFLSEFKQGLIDRWDVANNNEEPESKEYFQKLISLELNKIEKYLGEKFEDSALQEKAVKYINLLKKQNEALTYYGVDYEKYDTMWNEALNDRAEMITDMINTYEIEFPDKYNETVENFTVRSKQNKEKKLLDENIEEMKRNINFQAVEYSGDYTYYEAVVENITDKTFDSFCVDINLLDEDGIILESDYTSVSNLSPGQKAKLEFSSDKKFSSYELDVEYYIN